jgi:hypothetical protein
MSVAHASVRMLAVVRSIHTAIFLVMAASVFYIDYCGVVGRAGPLFLVAAGLIAIEGAYSWAMALDVP